ncbi:hypothetical protein [Streptomyces sp. NPDC046197]|uniref:hypothetical protein n=1 Tax=Streptomyces sp. NPDC046197 TaxID=3154337 RepID=UPI0033C3F69B
MPETEAAPAQRVGRTRGTLTLRLLAVWLLLIAAVGGAGATGAMAEPAPAGAHARHHSCPSLEGVWDLTVTIVTPDGGTTSTTPRFIFHADHKLSAEGPPDTNGRPQYEAHGFWNENGNGTFAFYVTHPGRSDGAYLGVVQAVHMGRIVGKTFSTHAYAFVTTSPGGEPQGPITVSSTATRVSDTAP